MSDLSQAIKVLNEGGIVIFPTDTAFGIGCRIDDERAIERLFKLRKRPAAQATPVLVDSTQMAQNYLLSPLPDNVRRLMKKYWPGALTVVYNCRKDIIPLFVRGGGGTVGLRMPNHDVPLALINSVGVPILGPSANFHGQDTPFAYSQLDPQLLKLVDYVIDGKCSIGNVSTVIDCVSNPLKIIRQGAVVIPQSFILSIDTSDSKKIKVSITIDGKTKNKTSENTWSSQKLLPLIDEILKGNKLKLTDLTEIKVHMGPGSYTGLRVGAAVANSLSWLLDIAVNGKKGKMTQPLYDKASNHTRFALHKPGMKRAKMKFREELNNYNKYS